MTTTPNADLLAHAREYDITLTDRGARKLRAERGDQGAKDRIAAVGALLALGSAFTSSYTQTHAFRQLDAAEGDYERAARRLLDEITDRRNNTFARSWSRYERELWEIDALSRHAGNLSRTARGALGQQTEMLLAAARHADLRDPGPDSYRRRIASYVDAAIDNRYPIRDTSYAVIDADQPNTRHRRLVEKAIRDEKDARETAMRRRPELRQRIDALEDSSSLRRNIDRVLNEIRHRLDLRVEDGWTPDPDRYRSYVIDRATADAQAA